MAPVVVIAQCTVPTDSVDAVLADLESLRTQSLSEAGCLGYDAYRSLEDPNTVVLIERYADDDAVAAHQNSAHYQEIVVGRVRPVLVDRRVEVLTPRSGT